MAIPASQIVQITPRIIRAGGNELSISGLLLTDNANAPFPALLSFTSSADVGSYFGTDSVEYKLANKYFLGYDNSFKKPDILYIARRAKTALSAMLIGSVINTTMDKLKAVTDGSMSIQLNDTVETVEGLDFSDTDTFSDVANKVQEKLAALVQGTTCTYSSDGRFKITIGTSGKAGKVLTATKAADGTDVSGMLGLTADSGAIESAGADAMTPQQQMDEIINQGTNWVSFTTVEPLTKDEIIGYSQWCNDQNLEYLFVAWSEDASLVQNGKVSDIVTGIQDNSGTALIYGTAEYAVFIMSIAASIDWDRHNGTVNYAMLSQSGLAATVTDQATANTLQAQHVNYYGRYATRAEDFIFLFKGEVTGPYAYLDAYVNTIWLRNTIQLALMIGLTQAGRVPYNDEGYAKVRSWMADPIAKALNNGVINTDVDLNQQQLSEVYAEAGTDITMALKNNGYYLQILDPGASVRANRGSPVINFWYCYGGSIDKLVVPLTALV